MHYSRFLRSYRHIFGFCSIIAFLLALSFSSCERYKQKHDARERRMDYLRHLADSSRTARDLYNDSLRHAQDSAAQATSNAQKAKKP